MRPFLYCTVCLRDTPHDLVEYGGSFGAHLYACTDCGSKRRSYR